MGLFDLFARTVDCPVCGRAGARKSLFSGVQCPNRDCVNFDSELLFQREGRARTRRDRGPREKLVARAPLTGDYDPGTHAIDVRYTNFLGEEKTFVGDRRTLRRVGRHFSVRVKPTGKRIALALNRIHNVDEVKEATERCPSRREARVLEYHGRRGSTSALYEELREKYPDWSPAT